MCERTGFLKLRSMTTGEYDYVRYDEITSIVGMTIDKNSNPYGVKPPSFFVDQMAKEWTIVRTDELSLHVAEKPSEIHDMIEKIVSAEDERKADSSREIFDMIDAMNS